MLPAQIAAVDLGSNSFRLLVAQVRDEAIQPIDSLKETVRLAAGLDAQKRLDLPARQRALQALARFAERLQGFAASEVRAVATDTLRVAGNAAAFLEQAEAVLGFPIEVIAGREEARLAYLGVARLLPRSDSQRLVIDIGGGSTEIIIGQNLAPLCLASLHMGCVSFSREFFPAGRIDRESLDAAIFAARERLQPVVASFRQTGWQAGFASSGTARALAEILEGNGWSASGITRAGLASLRARLLEIGVLRALTFHGLRADRLPILPGGLAITLALFDALDLEQLDYARGALRHGVLHDLCGRHQHHDQRDATVDRFIERYRIDRAQAARVAASATEFFRQLSPRPAPGDSSSAALLNWAARLHEIGLSVAHSGHHRHGAYLLANADMPGFSKQEQSRLSRLVLAQRGKLARKDAAPLDDRDRGLTLCLRLAIILHRSRRDVAEHPVFLVGGEAGARMRVDADWLSQAPLTAAALKKECSQWTALGWPLRIDKNNY